MVVAVAEAAEINMICSHHTRLTLQFHVTGKCNLSCKHCYRTDGNVEPLTLEDIYRVIDQFKELREKFNLLHKTHKRGHINITGGEPFMRSDFVKILEYLGNNKTSFTYGILSNGSFVDERIIEKLKETEVSFVQLSIDGDRQMHDSIRADGDYDRVFKTAELLEKSGIKTYISFTANKENYKFLPKLAKECRKKGISKLWSDRLVPIGNGKDMKALEITKDEMTDYISYLKKAQGGIITKWCYPKTVVAMDRALQFQNTNGKLYSCGAGRTLITVDEFGNVMPCRRMPIICGNISNSSLSEIYFCETFKQLRKDRVPKECHGCKYAYYCKGGARCQSYAKNASFLRADPACPPLSGKGTR